MFTGIVEAVGTLKSLQKRGQGAVIEVLTPESFALSKRVVVGDSIANNGVCLTATAVHGDSFTADVSAETMTGTCFAFYERGQLINLELACTPATHLGGHIMQGHVDGIGEVLQLKSNDEAVDVFIRCPHDLSGYIARKGSIAVDGVSLTVNDIENDIFRLTLIPPTQSGVNFTSWKAGSRVNLEADVLVRYLERLLEVRSQKSGQEQGVTLQSLMENGFI